MKPGRTPRSAPTPEHWWTVDQEGRCNLGGHLGPRLQLDPKAAVRRPLEGAWTEEAGGWGLERLTLTPALLRGERRGCVGSLGRGARRGSPDWKKIQRAILDEKVRCGVQEYNSVDRRPFIF